ncbi:MNIO family bufferin maturase [Acidithiobacillus sulfuriphilus]|uniref:MNIO family bufferin maturase n=1 Tax=Acidithiobacillus sulfuriphilus TaxID=1867749 RepID=UPI003F5EB8E8
MDQGTRAVNNAKTPDGGCIGIGLRVPQHREWTQLKPPVDFLEIHAENYFDAGSPARADLDLLRPDYAVSIHGVGLGLGNAALNIRHLQSLRDLVARTEPFVVSEHLCWTGLQGAYFNHLLPMPFTEETLARVSDHIELVQSVIGRPLLIEPIAAYLRYQEDRINEADLLNALVDRTGCGLLLDATNLYVNSRNHGENPQTFLEKIRFSAVEEIHLAGCHLNQFQDGRVWIDSHDRPVADEVWALYRQILSLAGPRPTLIERDANLPPLQELVDEAEHAQLLMMNVHEGALCR